MNSYQIDTEGQEVLLSKDNQQVMMEWEKPYMEASIDFLEPKGDVLEIGFGCGYSATQIMKYKPKSYTVIECDPIVIEKAKEWSKQFTIPIYIVEGIWQNKLNDLGLFDEIYFDDFPLDVEENSPDMEKLLSMKRINLFLDLCIQNHTKIGSKISFYLNNNSKVSLGSDTKPFVKSEYKSINMKIPETCQYRDVKEQKCLIPLLTKIRNYSFEYAQKKALTCIVNPTLGGSIF